MTTCKNSTRFRVMRWLVKSIAWVVMLVVVGYGLSNLCISSRWFLDELENKLAERGEFDWSIGSASWSPWNGATLKNVQIKQPMDWAGEIDEPLMIVDVVRVLPYWDEMLHGRVRLREVSIESPHITVSVEMVAALLKRVAPHDDAPFLARHVEKQQSQQKAPDRSIPLTPQTELAPPHPTGKPAAPDSKVVKNQQPNKPQPPKRPNPSKPKGRSIPTPIQIPTPPVAQSLSVDVKVSDASIKLVSVKRDVELLIIEGIDLDLPLLGESASKGRLKVRLLKIPGLPDITKLQQSIAWNAPYLEWGCPQLDVAGLDVRFRGKLALSRLAQTHAGAGAKNKIPSLGLIPIFMSFELPLQKLDRVGWFKRAALEVSSEQLVGKFQVGGVLQRPRSWRGDLLIVAQNLVLKELHGGHRVVFEEVLAPVTLAQSSLNWGGVKFIGEDISVLGNGRVSSVGDFQSVTRLVVSPEVCEMLTRALNGARLMKYHSQWWKNLDTPDRKMRDFHVGGTLMNPRIDLGVRDEEVSVWPIIKSILKFTREEMREEGRVLPAIPNSELLHLHPE